MNSVVLRRAASVTLGRQPNTIPNHGNSKGALWFMASFGGFSMDPEGAIWHHGACHGEVQ